MKSSFNMDADLAARFISSLKKSLQTVLHGCLDCDKDIELGGYVFLRIDNAQRIDYVLSEKMQKSDVNSMTFHSNSFLALPQPGSGTAANKEGDRGSHESSHLIDKQQVGSVNENVNRAVSHSNHTASCSSNVSSAARRHSDSFSHPGAGIGSLPARGSDRTQPLANFQAAFQSPAHSYGNQTRRSPASGNSQAFPQNGSSSRHFSGSGLPSQQQQQSKSSILPDASEIEVVHIKTEDEDEVFSIPFSCQQAGSSTDGLGAAGKWMAMRSRHPMLYNPYPRLSRSHSWDHRMSSPSEGFRFPQGGEGGGPGDGENLNLSCKVCGKTYRSRQGLIFHERAKHQNIFNVYCPVCGKGFQQTTHMYGHMATHTNVKHFGCQDCGARYAHKTSLMQHIRSGACRAQSGQSHSRSSLGSASSPNASTGLDLSNAQLFRDLPSYRPPSGPSSSQSRSDEPESPIDTEFPDPKAPRLTPQNTFDQHHRSHSFGHVDLTSPEYSFDHEGRHRASSRRDSSDALTDSLVQSSGLDLTMEDKPNETSSHQQPNDELSDTRSSSGMNLTLEQPHGQDSESNPAAECSSPVDEAYPQASTENAYSQISRESDSACYNNEDLPRDARQEMERERPSPEGDGSFNYSQDSDDPPATVSLSLTADDD